MSVARSPSRDATAKMLAGLQCWLGTAVSTVPGMLMARAARTPDSIAQWQQGGAEGGWAPRTWAAFQHDAFRAAVGLRRLGLRGGERVAIAAPTSARWDVVQMGVLAAGGVVVGVDPNELPANAQAIAKSSGVSGLVIAEPRLLDRFGEEVCRDVQFIVCLGSGESVDGAVSYDELLNSPGADSSRCELFVRPNDSATIIFTSGTTGAPKGIEYSHRQVCLAVASILEAFPDLDGESRLACWLPLSNLFQRIVNNVAIAWGAQTYYVEDPQNIVAHLATIEPDLFIAVPRFYEKLYAGISANIAAAPAIQRMVVSWAMRQGDAHAKSVRANEHFKRFGNLKYKLADRVALSKIRAVAGSRLRYMVSGSAPMPNWLLERFHAMGILVLEAYGLSENIIPVAMNTSRAYRFGTVGRPMPGCDVTLAEDGEVLVRGPGVSRAYLGEKYSSLLDADGYLPTGDMGKLDCDGFLTLTARKSEIIKTATGRRVAPSGVESILLRIPGVEQAAIFGQGRSFLVGVVTLSTEAVTGDQATTDSPVEFVARCDHIRALIAKEVSSLPSYQRPAGLIFTNHIFSVAAGELTSNLKLRRGRIAERYGDAIQQLYTKLEGAGREDFLDTVELDTGILALCRL